MASVVSSTLHARRSLIRALGRREMQTTPEAITGQIRAFLRQVGLKEKPVYLPYTFFDSRYRNSYCIDNCVHAERNRLGTILYGWIIWHSSRHRFTEAEFHAVLQTEDQILDITPRKDGESLILFVPDPTRCPKETEKGWDTYSNIRFFGQKAGNGKLVVLG